MGKLNVYLDDLRKCPEGFVIARTMEEALTYCRQYPVHIVSLDHDLGEENGQLLPTGYDFVKAFCEEGLFVDVIYIHTDNPVGRANMYETLLAAQRRGFISENIKIYHYGCVPNIYED